MEENTKEMIVIDNVDRYNEISVSQHHRSGQIHYVAHTCVVSLRSVCTILEKCKMW